MSGSLTRRVLRTALEGESRDDAARLVWERRGPEVSAGNGSVMYCAPLGAFRAERPDLLLEEAPALSAITHWDERCRTACLAVTLAVAALVRGEGHRESVERAVEAVIGREGGEELEYLVAEAGRARRIDGPDMGFALFTAGIGLQMAAEGPSFEEGLRHVVSLGGDTDTNAAVTGALLGALHGREELPSAWLEKLVDRQAIEAEAEALADRGDRLGSGRRSQPGHVLIPDPADDVDRLQIRQHPDGVAERDAESTCHLVEGPDRRGIREDLRDRVDAVAAVGTHRRPPRS